MKIAMVTDSFAPNVGGIESQVRDLSLQLQARGHDVIIVTATPATNGPRTGTYADFVDGLHVQRVTSRFLGRTPVTPVARQQLLASLSGADVVHIHTGLVSPFAWQAAMVCHEYSLPAVMSWHCVLTAWQYALTPLRTILRSGIRHNIVASRARSEVAYVTDSPHITVIPDGVSVDFWRGIARKRLEKSGERAVSNTSSYNNLNPVADEKGSGEAVRSPGLREVERGVSSDEKGSGEATRASKLTVVSARRLAPRKRVRALIDAVATVREWTGADVRLTIFGDGCLKGVLERYLAVKNYFWVELPGKKTREELARAYENADIYASLSTREAFGIATLEARAAGLPIVSPQGTGADDFIDNEFNGLLSEANNDDDFARKLAYLVVNRPLRERIANTNATTNPQENWDVVCEQTLEEYLRVFSPRQQCFAEHQ
ncbi:glycosyltransferase family 4 protein [Actinotignum urinale]|uniref:glycosyltransferase family 4 protein n=1 Tax=Actinotignum urinale TaxID=190146 RepID=UPI002A82B4C4|nr:glycosyltransferase family 4 protein [Actinotignum urinale]MDY5129624.1 glycosyltransferase family 4 protein [Actinotignum urinale]